ncbi:MAG: hypothetical protein AB1714_11020 [Acidobacteriota bacterium]
MLDIFGDLADQQGVMRLARAIGAYSVHVGAACVTVLVASPALRAAFLRLGYIARTSTRLRWWTNEPELMKLVGNAECHWSLADSDNDTIE